MLYLHNNAITEIENLEPLHKLQILYLQKNKIAQIKGLDKLQQLRKIYLGYNQISVVENLHNLTNLEELHLEKQQLNKGEVMCFDPRSIVALSNSLQVLNISDNNITSINDLLPLHNLQLLKASYNNIKGFNETATVLACLYRLREADFRGNPMVKLHRYRETIIANTYQLGKLLKTCKYDLERD